MTVLTDKSQKTGDDFAARGQNRFEGSPVGLEGMFWARIDPGQQVQGRTQGRQLSGVSFQSQVVGSSLQGQ